METAQPTLQEIKLNRFELFTAQYLSHHLTKPVCQPHRQVYGALADESIKLLAIEFWRGGGKSTIGNMAFTLFSICEGEFGDEFEVQSVSASGGPTGLSTKNARKIRKELTENELLIYDYQIECSQGTEYFSVKMPGRQVEVYCRGKGTAIRGSRGLVIVDDPQSIKDCQSQTILEADHYWFYDDVLPVILDEQRLVFIYTSISPLSLGHQFAKKKGVTSLKFAVDDPVGSFNSVWPEKFPEHFLRERYELMGRDSFDAEYRCKPLVSGNPIFKEDWIKYYLKGNASYQGVTESNNYTILAVDTAMSKKKINDQTAYSIGTAKLVQKPDYFIRNAESGQYSTKEGVTKCINLIKTYQPDLVWVETACNFPDKDGWIEELETQLHINNMTANLMWGHPSESKVHRALSVQGLVQSGRVYFDEEDEQQERLIADLIVFIGDDKMPDDRVDAFVHGLRAFQNWLTNYKPVNIKSALAGKW